MPEKREPILKAFVLCDEIRQRFESPQMDLLGAGLYIIRPESSPPFPCKQSFWVYLHLADENPPGRLNLAIMRGDSGIRYSFRRITVEHSDPLRGFQLAIRVFDFDFPEPGIYFVELWYDGQWIIDHRLELIG